ncbi:hypothetical protein AQS70_17655 [Pseudomonas endophytica]|uniref:Uncharacterized protein n=1 Tax=Pseudomonas endophytica TaxID=1563157 RepID=A0A0Q0WVE2_9PSED|nr:phage baseplate assembly protein V [Pseudomonas endophytica]KQB51570.1 hypothetical protein AQS70_17655 [Pseudomonas endophytica]
MPNEEIFCDKWGRVKVSFPWDRASQNNEHSSCWIRVAQGWAGTTWGAMAIPRIGQELIIQYFDGDPYVHAEKDQNVMVNNNETHTVGVDRTHAVGQDETITVGRNSLRVVKTNDTLKVGGNKNDHVAGEYYIGVGSKLRLECGKTVIELNANGDLSITCENINITANQAGQINTPAGMLDLNVDGGKAAATADGREGSAIQAEVNSHFKQS